MISQQTIQRIRQLPIEGVAERLGLRVIQHKALCPFHEDSHPSLSFHVGKNTFRCFVCDAHGGPIDLAMKLLPSATSPSSASGTFVEACEWLADEHHIILSNYAPPPKQENKRVAFDPQKYIRFFEHPSLNEAARVFLFEERKLDPSVVRWCRLNSFTDKQGIPWLQIPYFNMDGQLIGVQSRNLSYQSSAINNQSSAVPRFKFPYGHNCHIYNLPVLKLLKPGEDLYITEGASDCWAILSSGHKAIAIPSATLLKPADLEPLKQWNAKSEIYTDGAIPSGGAPFLHMFPDKDAPGERLFLKLKELFPNLIRHELPEGCKDFGAYWQEINRNR